MKSRTLRFAGQSLAHPFGVRKEIHKKRDRGDKETSGEGDGARKVVPSEKKIRGGKRGRASSSD